MFTMVDPIGRTCEFYHAPPADIDVLDDDVDVLDIDVLDIDVLDCRLQTDEWTRYRSLCASRTGRELRC